MVQISKILHDNSNENDANRNRGRERTGTNNSNGLIPVNRPTNNQQNEGSELD